jgi:hypothetical protein
VKKSTILGHFTPPEILCASSADGIGGEAVNIAIPADRLN